MQLIKELLSLNEANEDDNEVEALTKMEDGPQKNVKAVDLMLRADGDIPLGKGSKNQMDSMGEQDGNRMYYVAIDPPHGTVEAYVVVGKSGNFSYYDFTDEVVVIDGKLMQSERVTRDWADRMDELSDEYGLEGGKVKEGGIKAFLDHLKTADD